MTLASYIVALLLPLIQCCFSSRDSMRLSSCTLAVPMSLSNLLGLIELSDAGIGADGGTSVLGYSLAHEVRGARQEIVFVGEMLNGMWPVHASLSFFLVTLVTRCKEEQKMVLL